jgi:RNA polymerase sporulation-specific sigma factor
MAHVSTYGPALSYHQMPDEEVVRYAKRGHQPAIDHLLHKYKNLVEGRAKAYFMLGADHDDVVQEGMIGLYKAIRDFSDEHLSAFRSFADLCVTRQIISAVKAARRQKHQLLSRSVSLGVPPTPDGEVRSLDDIPEPRPSNPEQLLMGCEFREQVLHQVQQILSDLECEVLWAYIQGQTYQEISTQLGCTVKRIDNALQRAKKKMARKLRWQLA